MKTWFVVFGSLFLFFQSPELESCAGGDEDAWEMTRFFKPELANRPSYAPLYFSFARLYDEGWEANADAFRRSENLRDWQQFIENLPKTTDIEQLVYKTSVKDLQAVKASFQNPLVTLKPVLQNNAMVKTLLQKKDAATLDYLIFAKTCEPFALQGDEWSEGGKTVNSQIIKLIAQSEQNYVTATQPFLKLRYAYQGIRLAHYARSYARAVGLYDKLVAPLTLESPVKYWALGHKAGVIRRSGQNNALAAYLFSVVFDKSESKRINSYYSFKISSDAEWQKTMTMCKSNHEKATLHFLRAIQPHNLMLEEMKSIYALDPTAEYLDVLLVREINKYEQAGKEDPYISGGVNLNSFKNGNAALKAFIAKVVSEGKIKNKPLWTLALGYCDYLAGKPQEARKTFAQLPAASQTPEVKNQIETFDLMIQLAEVQKLDAATEERLYQAVTKTKSESLKILMVNVFKDLYKKQGEKAKEFLSNGDLYSLRTEATAPLVEQLLAFADKPKKTSYENEMLNKLKIDKASPKEVLLEMKATFLLKDDKLDEAEKIFSSITYKTDGIQGNAADEQIKDCHECAENSDKRFSKLQLIGQIKSLKKQATSTDKAQAAEATYRLGNVYYNTTWFGFAWRVMSYYRSYGFSKPQPNQPVYENYDCSKALNHYNQAAELAKQLGNQELAAKCLFMAAKCEQNDWYLRFIPKDGQDYYYEGIPPSYAPADRKYFTQLKQQYATTEFYKEARAQCFYLNRFAQ